VRPQREENTLPFGKSCLSFRGSSHDRAPCRRVADSRAVLLRHGIARSGSRTLYLRLWPPCNHSLRRCPGMRRGSLNPAPSSPSTLLRALAKALAGSVRERKPRLRNTLARPSWGWGTGRRANIWIGCGPRARDAGLLGDQRLGDDPALGAERTENWARAWAGSSDCASASRRSIQRPVRGKCAFSRWASRTARARPVTAPGPLYCRRGCRPQPGTVRAARCRASVWRGVR
jgi:hypothetical protein